LRALLDTSILVAVFYEEHQHHEASFALLSRLASEEVFFAAHSLAEVYATLTAMPGRDRISGSDAVMFLKSIRQRLTLVYLDGEEYLAAMEAAADGGFASGGVYDVLIGQCALKAQVDVLYTWNIKHFRRLPPPIANRAKTPLESDVP